MAGAPWLSAALVSLGPNSDLFFNGSVSLDYQSNIFLDDPQLTGVSEVDDFAFIFSPGVELNFGDGTAANNVLILVREDIKVHNDNSKLDSEDFFFLFNLTYAQAPIDIEASVNFFELVQNTAAANRLGALTESEMTNVKLRGEYEISAKTSIEGRFGYLRTDYITTGLNDNRTLEFPVNVYYAYSPKLDASVGFRYRHTEVTDGPDTDDYFFNVGFRGELTPKLETTVQIGVISRDFGTTLLGDDTSLGVNSSFTWYSTDLTTVDATINLDYSTGGTSASLQNTGASLSVLHSITPMITGNMIFSYNNAEYRDLSGREDDSYNAAFSINYSPSDYLTFRASYSYLKNDSTQLGGNFDNSILSIVASLRY